MDNKRNKKQEGKKLRKSEVGTTNNNKNRTGGRKEGRETKEEANTHKITEKNREMKNRNEGKRKD